MRVGFDASPVRRFPSGVGHYAASLLEALAVNHPEHQYWEDGRQAKVVDLRAGETLLYDLKRNPVVLLDQPFHSLHFYLSRAALLEIADEAEAPPIGELNYTPGMGVEDPAMASLAPATCSSCRSVSAGVNSTARTASPIRTAASASRQHAVSASPVS